MVTRMAILCSYGEELWLLEWQHCVHMARSYANWNGNTVHMGRSHANWNGNTLHMGRSYGNCSHGILIICTKYRKNPSRTVCALEWTQQDVPYFSNFIAKLSLNDLEDNGQGQNSLHARHPLILVIICAKYGRNHPELYLVYSGHGKMWIL